MSGRRRSCLPWKVRVNRSSIVQWSSPHHLTCMPGVCLKLSCMKSSMGSTYGSCAIHAERIMVASSRENWMVAYRSLGRCLQYLISIPGVSTQIPANSTPEDHHLAATSHSVFRQNPRSPATGRVERHRRPIIHDGRSRDPAITGTAESAPSRDFRLADTVFFIRLFLFFSIRDVGRGG